MGSTQDDLISAEEAAKMLESSIRTVDRMVTVGLLTAIYERAGHKAKRFFRRSEIAAVASLKLKKMDLSTVANIAIRALAAAQASQQQLGDIRALLGLEGRSLGMEEVDIVALYIQVQDALDSDNYPTVEEVREWAKTFLSITEEYLRTVVFYTEQKDPWKDFMLLGEKLSKEAPKQLFHQNKMLEAAYALLEPARKHLRQVSYFYVRNVEGNHVASKKFPGIEKNLDETLINLLLMH